MQLDRWMRNNRWHNKQFVKEINKLLEENGHDPVAPTSVSNWRRGIAVPRPPVVAAIETFTQGAVLYVDHVAAVNERAAA